MAERSRYRARAALRNDGKCEPRGRANALTRAAIGRRRPILLQPTPGLLGDSDCGRGAFERVILRRSQFESGTSCHGTPFFFIFCPWEAIPPRSWECSSLFPLPQMKSASPKNTLRFDEHSYGHNGSVNAAVWSADDTDRVSNAKCYLLVSRHGRACPGSCRTKCYGHPPLISSPPLRPVSFVAGIDMIWHQMRARSAIAAAFFTIALLRFRKTVVQTA